MQGVRAHQDAPQLAHGALLPVGALTVEQEGDGEVQERVAQEFQALVVPAGSGRSVGKGLDQQVRVLEPVAQPGLQLAQIVLGSGHDQSARSGGSCWFKRARWKARFSWTC